MMGAKTNNEMLLPLKANFQIMRAWGLYAEGEKRNKWFYAWIAFFLLFTGFLAIGGIGHLIGNLRAKKQLDSFEMLEDLFLIVAVVTVDYVLILFVVKSPVITELAAELKDFSLFGMPENTLAVDKKINMYVYMYFVYCMVGTMSYCILAKYMFNGPEKCAALRKKNGSYNTCSATFNMWFFHEFTETGEFILYLVQTMAMTSFIGSASCFFTIIWSSAEHIIIRIDDLCSKLKNVFEGDTNEHQANVKNCVLYHRHILQLIEKLNLCYSSTLFIHMIVSAVIISLSGYMAMRDKVFVYSVLTFGYLVAIFINCLAGQRLLDKSLEISFEIYNCSWYNTDLPLRKDIFIMLMRSQRPLTLKCAGYGVMSFITYQTVVKAAFSYLTLMRNTASR